MNREQAAREYEKRFTISHRETAVKGVEFGWDSRQSEVDELMRCVGAMFSLEALRLTKDPDYKVKRGPVMEKALSILTKYKPNNTDSNG